MCRLHSVHWRSFIQTVWFSSNWNTATCISFVIVYFYRLKVSLIFVIAWFPAVIPKSTQWSSPDLSHLNFLETKIICIIRLEPVQTSTLSSLVVTLYLMCQFWDLPIQQHIKICQKYRQMAKILWETEKMVITSNFSFSHNVLKSCLVLMHQNKYQWSKGLTGKKKMVRQTD